MAAEESKPKAMRSKPLATPTVPIPTGSLARTAGEIAKLDLTGLKDARGVLSSLKGFELTGVDPAKLRAFSELGAAAKRIAERPEAVVSLPAYRPYPSAEVRAIQAVEARTKGVNQAVVDLAVLIEVQAKIAERQEAGIVNVVAKLEESRIASDRASGRLATLTVVLIALTAIIALLTLVLIIRGT
jgi:hypothetical protein